MTASALALSACGKKGDPTGQGARGAPSPTTGSQPAGGGLALGLSGFEGEVTVSMHSSEDPKPVPPMTLQVKGGKLRLDLPQGVGAGGNPGGAYFVLSAPEKKAFTVIEREHIAMLMDFGMLGSQLKSFAPPASPGQPEALPSSPPKITKTGRTDTVAGYRCEDWEISDSRGRTGTVCVANEGAPWLELPTLGLTAEQAWAREIADGRHFPLRFIGYSETGAEHTRIEVTRLEKKSILDARFELPPGYRMMDLAESMREVSTAMQGAGARQVPPGVKLPPEVLAKIRAAGAAMPSAR